MDTVVDEFRTAGYHRHNLCRQNHLASLHLPVAGKTVLELGAGIGDHTGFFLDRNCAVTCVEARPENIRRLKDAHTNVAAHQHNLDAAEFPPGRFQVVYAYGILYHLREPTPALRRWSECCTDLLLLETCVAPDDAPSYTTFPEDPASPTASFVGTAFRPTRRWVVRQLKRWFPHAYMPITQPDHEEFPLDWAHMSSTGGLTRAVFVASRTPLDNPLLTEEIPRTQLRATI